MSFPRVTTYTYTLRPDLEVEINDGESGPRIYLAGVVHNVSTVEQYILLLQDAIKQAHEWYADWDGWSGDGDHTREYDWSPLLKEFSEVE